MVDLVGGVRLAIAADQSTPFGFGQTVELGG
jgi:hypothetical protein